MNSSHQPTDQPPYWSVSPGALLERLKTSSAGLSEAEARRRLELYGANRLASVHGGPVREAVLSQLRNPLLWLLLFAASVGTLVGEATDSTIILIILALGALLSIVQESRAGRALERLRERLALRARVVRDGQEIEVLASSVVPGDILLLNAGTLIAADTVLLEARDLYIGEAALTGESFPVEKRPGPVAPEEPLAARLNVVHMGTNVRSGTGRAVVVETGTRTAFGQIAAHLALRPPETEFQRGLRRFGYLLLSLMVALVFIVFTASAIRQHPAVDALLFAVALAVGLAPEMLPAVLATLLARGARRMSKRGVLVRRLEAIENLGNMDVLCTDKTGTLTEGEGRLERTTDCTGEDSRQVLRLVWWNAALQQGLPNPLDRAIVEACRGHQPDPPNKLDEIPFDFSRKRLSVLIQPPGQDPLLITKGAAGSIVSACASARDSTGVPVPLGEELRGQVEERVASWSRQGVRVIAVATRPWPADEPLHRGAEQNLILEGFALFRDPPKPDVAQALQELRGMGIRVKIISGDHPAVVGHLAEQVGLKASRVVQGSDLAAMRDEALWHLVGRTDLFAEIDPNQKERLILALKKTGHVVGFMGDGINDAPAIHAADVGISVDGAADVAREAADFVLLQRDLTTVLDGVREGRTTLANTLKYVLTTESANLGNMLSMAAAALFLPFLPLLAHQVLLNNLLSDIPSATLSGDRVDPESVRKPQRWDVAFIRRFMLAFGLISAAFDGLTFFALTHLFKASPEEFRTAWFAQSLLTELFVLLILRTRRRFWNSRPHAALLVSTLAVAVLAVVLPQSAMGGLLGFVKISGTLWFFVLGIAAAYVFTVEAIKRPLLTRLERPTSRRQLRRSGHQVWPR